MSPTQKEKPSKQPVMRKRKQAHNRDAQSPAHYHAILLEAMRAEFKFVMEHVVALRDAMDLMKQDIAAIAHRLDRVESRLDAVERRLDRVEHLLDENALRWQENTTFWQENAVWQRETIHLLSHMDRHFDRLDGTALQHDTRLIALEQRVFV